MFARTYFSFKYFSNSATAPPPIQSKKGDGKQETFPENLKILVFKLTREFSTTCKAIVGQ